MSTDTPRTNAVVEANLGRGNLVAHNRMLDHARTLERTLATTQLEATKLREALDRLCQLKHLKDTDFAGSPVLKKTYELRKAGAWADAREALSTPITTDALDSYVAEKVKEARGNSEQAEQLFKQIEHGDEQHRAWLKNELVAFFAEQAVK